MAVLPMLAGGSAQADPQMARIAQAAPAADCAVAYPVAELTDEQAVTGLTVSRGTTPEPFSGTVLGVLDDGIAPGIDMIIARLDSPAIDAAGGIWAGMSGSPVYAADGRLIGAVAYGLAYGSSPVAGITPFDAMDDYLGAGGAPLKVSLTKPMAAKVAAQPGVSRRAAAGGLSQLRMPVGISGVSARLLARTAGKRSYLPTDAYALGAGARADGPTADTIVAGGNIAASTSFGDITSAAVGTATSVCDGDVVGFGHPFNFAGETTLSLHPADALYIQEDPLGAPFKVANLGAPVGVVDEDRLTGITGTFGPTPDTTTITSDATFGTRSRVGSSEVSVPAALPEIAFYEHLNNLATVIDAEGPGSQTQVWTITGSDGEGTPFTITYSDRFSSDFDNLVDSAFDLSDVLYELTSLPGVRIDAVTNEVDASSDHSTYQVGRLEQRRGGAWVKVTERKPVVGHPGRLVRLRAELIDGDTTTYSRLSVKIPRKAAGAQGSVSLYGGGYGGDFGEGEGEGEFKSAPTARVHGGHTSPVDAVVKELANRVRHDQVGSDLSLRGRAFKLAVTKVSDPFEMVVEGNAFASVRIAKK